MTSFEKMMSPVTNFAGNVQNKITQAQQNLSDLTAMAHLDFTPVWAKNPKVLAERILQRSSIMCSITIPQRYWENKQLSWSTKTFPFYTDADFGFSLQNNWTKLHSGLENLPLLSNVTNAASILTHDAQVTFQSESMSSCSWKGSEFGSFNLSCLFICTNRRINPVDAIKNLATACLPAKMEDYAQRTGGEPLGLDLTKSIGKTVVNVFEEIGNNILSSHKDQVSKVAKASNKFLDDVGLVAPLDYGTYIDGEGTNAIKPLPGTTLSFHIGDWFYATDLVVESISGIQFSKELVAPVRADNVRSKNDLYDPSADGNEYGFPLYAKCNISLKPYTLVDYKRFMNYFVMPNKPVLDSNNLFNLPKF